jgi:hypothetical protein
MLDLLIDRHRRNCTLFGRLGKTQIARRKQAQYARIPMVCAAFSALLLLTGSFSAHDFCAYKEDARMDKRLVWRQKVGSLRVTCTRGSCWITWQGGTDIILRAGECLEVRNVRRLCVEFLQQGDGYLEESDGAEPRRGSFRLPSSALGMQSNTRACW